MAVAVENKFSDGIITENNRYKTGINEGCAKKGSPFKIYEKCGFEVKMGKR